MTGDSGQMTGGKESAHPGWRFLRWAGLILLVGAALGLYWLSAVIGRAPGQPIDPAGLVFSLSVPLLFLASGLAIMARRPWHQVGWLLMIIALGWPLTSSPINVAGIAPHWYPWIAWAYDGIGGYISYAAMMWLLLVFPDGLSERSRWGRLVGQITIGATVAATMLSFAAHPVHGGDESALGFYPNPLGLNWLPRSVVDRGLALIIFGVMACVASLGVRHRRASGETRRRYTVVLYSFWLLVLGVVFGLALFNTIGAIAWWPAQIGWAAVPLSFVYALVRHGLYGVDKVVSRTVTYGLLAIAITAVYAIPVLLVPRLVGGSNQIVVAAATLAAAAAFNPLRRRIQTGVDRRFNRSRFDARQEVEAFIAGLPAEVELEGVTGHFLEVTSRILQPSRAGLWMKGADE